MNSGPTLAEIFWDQKRIAHFRGPPGTVHLSVFLSLFEASGPCGNGTINGEVDLFV